jgi:hypothetical protein
MKWLYLAALFSASSIVSTQLVAADGPGDAIIARNAHRLKQGMFFYRDLDHGKEVGKSSISIKSLPGSGNYRFSNEATLAAGFSGFHSQRWQAIASADFAPVSAVLEFVGGSESSPIFDLHYAARRVSGYVIERKAAAPVKRPVDDPILENTVDQRIDWAAAISSSLVPGRQSEFTVYDPATGVSRVVERVAEPETIKTPAGVFAAIRIEYEVEKRGRVERYVVFATRTLPRVMVREDFPNGVVTELTGMSD